MDWEQLDQALVRFAPVLVHYDRPDPHFALAVGIRQGWMITIDPSRGAELLSKDEFLKRWSGAVLLVAAKDRTVDTVERSKEHEVRLGVDYSGAFSGASVSGQLVPALEYTWREEWSTTVTWPWKGRYIVDDKGNDKFQLKSGNPSFSVERQSHSNAGRSSLSVGWEYPSIDDL